MSQVDQDAAEATVSAAGAPEPDALLARVAARVLAIEGRLERALTSGWRNAAGEGAALGSEADGLAELGMVEVAARVRAVAAAPSASEALGAIALALAACRLLRTRLAGEALLAPAEGWQPLGMSKRRGRGRSETPDRVLPVARTAVGEGEAWLCLRLAGGYAGERLLVDPAPLAATEGDGGGHGQRTVAEPPWLASLLRGRLRWRARHALGAAGTIERCALLDGTVTLGSDGGAPAESESSAWVARMLDQLGKTLRGGWKEGAHVTPAFGHIRLSRLHVREAESYLWSDPAAAAAFRQAGAALKSDRVWAIVWQDQAAVQPLALLSPGGIFSRPALVHLVPGLPRTKLA